MSERYYITGVQLGMLIASPEHKGRHKIADEIIDKQYLGTKQEFEKSQKKPEEKTEIILCTVSQHKYISQLKEEGHIPEDLETKDLSKEEAQLILEEAVKKKVDKKPQEQDYGDY